MPTQTMNPLMRDVFDIIVARDEATENEIRAWLAMEEDDDATGAYEAFLAPAIDALSDSIARKA